MKLLDKQEQEELIFRRKNFFSFLAGRYCLLIGNELKFRNNYIIFPFFQEENFYYFSFLSKENSLLLFNSLESKVIAFVHCKTAREELYHGVDLSFQQMKENFLFDEVLEVKDFFSYLTKLNIKNLFINYFSHNSFALNLEEELVKKGIEIEDKKPLQTCFSNLRLKKSLWEQNLIRKSCLISSQVHNEILDKRGEFSNERQIEAYFEFSCKDKGAEALAYPSIVGSGDNSLILHYGQNNCELKSGDLVLLDAACRYRSYCSDITRTFPFNKKFNSLQKEIYLLVLKVLDNCLFYIQESSTFWDLHKKIVNYLSTLLQDIGFLKDYSLDEIISQSLYKRFFSHFVGHSIGLEVHDFMGHVKNFKLEKDICLAIEPAIYIDLDNPYVPEEAKGIGIRIEDDFLIKENKEVENLTITCLKDIKSIERD